MNTILRKVVFSVAIAMIATVLGIQLAAESAYAQFGIDDFVDPADIIPDCVPVCPKHLPGGSDPLGTYPTNGSTSSCLSVFTDTYYEFRIRNVTNTRVYYAINGNSYELASGYYREHKFQKAYGTNSCNTQTFKMPEIRFDSSYLPGFQAKSYDIGGQNSYMFTASGNDLALFIDDGRALPTSVSQPPVPKGPSPASPPLPAAKETPVDMVHYLKEKMNQASVVNDYPYQGELFVQNLVGFPSILSTVEQSSQVGDRTNALVDRVWGDWSAYGLDHMREDPANHGQKPFRQLVIRIVQGTQGPLSAQDQQALESFYSRAWTGDIRGIIGAIHREVYGIQ